MGVRIVTALAALVSAVVHGYLWVDGYRDIDVIGPAFLVNAVAGAVIAVLLLVWRHWVPAFLVTGFGASTLGAFVVSATVGLFGVNETWTGGWVLIGGCLGGRVHRRWARAAVPRVGAPAAGRRQTGSLRTTTPSAVRTSTSSISSRLVAVAPDRCMVRPGSPRHVATCSARPSRVRTTRA